MPVTPSVLATKKAITGAAIIFTARNHDTMGTCLPALSRVNAAPTASRPPASDAPPMRERVMPMASGTPRPVKLQDTPAIVAMNSGFLASSFQKLDSACRASAHTCLLYTSADADD